MNLFKRPQRSEDLNENGATTSIAETPLNTTVNEPNCAAISEATVIGTSLCHSNRNVLFGKVVGIFVD